MMKQGNMKLRSDVLQFLPTHRRTGRQQWRTYCQHFF